MLVLVVVVLVTGLTGAGAGLTGAGAGSTGAGAGSTGAGAGLTGAGAGALCFHVFGIPSTWLAVKEKEEAKEQKIRNACKVERILRLMC